MTRSDLVEHALVPVIHIVPDRLAPAWCGLAREWSKSPVSRLEPDTLWVKPHALKSSKFNILTVIPPCPRCIGEGPPHDPK